MQDVPGQGSLYAEPAVDLRKVMRKRKVWVEPLFGEVEQWHGLQRFRLRGLTKVNIEGLLIAAGQNLKRWVAKLGWGRRHGPRGVWLSCRNYWRSRGAQPDKPSRDTISTFFNGQGDCAQSDS
jgi:hypothetical protein